MLAPVGLGTFCVKTLSAGTVLRAIPVRIGHFHPLAEIPYSDQEGSGHELFPRTAGRMCWL